MGGAGATLDVDEDEPAVTVSSISDLGMDDCTQLRAEAAVALANFASRSDPGGLKALCAGEQQQNVEVLERYLNSEHLEVTYPIAKFLMNVTEKPDALRPLAEKGLLSQMLKVLQQGQGNHALFRRALSLAIQHAGHSFSYDSGEVSEVLQREIQRFKYDLDQCIEEPSIRQD